MEPNAALQEPPVEPSVPTVLSSVWQSCGGEMYNCERRRCSQATRRVWRCGCCSASCSRKRNQQKSEQIRPPPTSPSSLKHRILVHVSCSKSISRNNPDKETGLLTTQARAHRRKTEHKAGPQPGCSIQDEHTVTTSAFHVLFKIMRSSSLLLIEEQRLFLPLNRHMSRTDGRSDRRKEMQKNTRIKTKSD